MDLITVQYLGRDFRRAVHRRNLRETFAAGVVATFFAGVAVTDGDLYGRVCAGSVMLGAGFVAWTLYRRGEPPAAAPATTAPEIVAQLRADLIHQAQLLETVAVWYLGPLVPGLAGLLLRGAWVGAWGPPWVSALVLSGAAALIVGVWSMNLRASRALRADADALLSAL